MKQLKVINVVNDPLVYISLYHCLTVNNNRIILNMKEGWSGNYTKDRVANCAQDFTVISNRTDNEHILFHSLCDAMLFQ